VARQEWQICRGTWPLNAGNGAVYRRRPLVSQESDAHTGNGEVLLQTPAAAQTADKGVMLSADTSHLVTSIRPVSPAGEYAPAAADLAPIQAERVASQHGQERITRQEPIKVAAPATHQQKCVALFRGVTTADLPEGI
jgi:hypothetical protein